MARRGCRSSGRETSLLNGALVALVGSLLWAGCSQSSKSSSDGGALREILPAEARTLEERPGEERTVEESDLFKVVGSKLLVQNPTRGLTVVDVSAPDRPAVATQLATLVGKSGELYASGDDAFVTFKESRTVAGQCEIAAVRSATTTPTPVATLNVPGRLVTSRHIGNFIYMVSTESDRTWVSSISTADPLRMSVASQRSLTGGCDEAHVSSRAIYLPQRLSGEGGLGTRVRAVDISDPGGAVVEKGEVKLRGFPQGRFHMDEAGTTFRIVTFTSRSSGSNVTAIDATDLSRLSVLGSIEGLAPGEDLHATRFVGDRVYVVTYEQPVITVYVGGGFGLGLGGLAIAALLLDPLWVVSLKDPTNPTVLGHLKVPGWSDYVFPRGDRLLAVGRGNLGSRVAVSLYDVADLSRPTELRRVEFGVPEASSEANTDFRGVRIVEAGVVGSAALVAIPYTNNLRAANGEWTPEHHVQLLDLLPDDLALRGSSAQVGLVRRTVPVGGMLYTITDKTVAAVDVSNRSAPVIPASVVVGDLSVAEKATPAVVDRPRVEVVRTGCHAAPGEPSRDAIEVAPLGLVLFVALALRRGRARAGRVVN